MRVLADDTCRPFCKQRRGLVLGEGAAVFVLETLEDARARAARRSSPRSCGAGMSADAGDIVFPSEAGAALAMRRALADAQLAPEDVDYINAHGTGTPANDPTETRAIRATFGAHADALAVSSTKSMHGHALGAAGAIELVATIGALRDGVVAADGELHRSRSGMRSRLRAQCRARDAGAGGAQQFVCVRRAECGAGAAQRALSDATARSHCNVDISTDTH